MRRILALATLICVGHASVAAEPSDGFANASCALRIQASGAHLRIPTSTSIGPTSALTVEAWAAFDPSDESTGMEIVKRGNDNKGYGVAVNPGTRIVGTIFGQHSNLVTSPPPWGGAWHHVAWTFDGTISRLYFDGALLQQVAYSGAVGVTTSDLLVGIGIHGDGTWNGATARGWCDEIRIWNVARSASEIAAAHASPLTGSEPGLVGYWNFDGGDASDLSPLGNHGALANGAFIESRPQDSSAPSLVLPPDVLVECTSPSGQLIDIGTAVASVECGSVVVSNDAPDFFALGTTIVTWTAAGPHGMSSQATQAITVQDTTAPALLLPDDIEVFGAKVDGAVVTYSVSASDTCGPATVVCSPNSGSLFPRGSSTVVCTATDTAGNSTTGSFTVTVNKRKNPK